MQLRIAFIWAVEHCNVFCYTCMLAIPLWVSVCERTLNFIYLSWLTHVRTWLQKLMDGIRNTEDSKSALLVKGCLHICCQQRRFRTIYQFEVARRMQWSTQELPALPDTLSWYTLCTSQVDSGAGTPTYNPHITSASYLNKMRRILGATQLYCIQSLVDAIPPLAREIVIALVYS